VDSLIENGRQQAIVVGGPAIEKIRFIVKEIISHDFYDSITHSLIIKNEGSGSYGHKKRLTSFGQPLGLGTRFKS
jgi:hypothetical protein